MCTQTVEVALLSNFCRDRQRDQGLNPLIQQPSLSQHVANVPIVFQRFTNVHGSSVRHGCNKKSVLAWSVAGREGKGRQGKARQGKARQGKAREGKGRGREAPIFARHRLPEMTSRRFPPRLGPPKSRRLDEALDSAIAARSSGDGFFCRLQPSLGIHLVLQYGSTVSYRRPYMPTKISHCLTRLTDKIFGGVASLPEVSMMIKDAPKMPVSHRATSARTSFRSIKVELRNIFG